MHRMIASGVNVGYFPHHLLSDWRGRQVVCIENTLRMALMNGGFELDYCFVCRDKCCK